MRNGASFNNTTFLLFFLPETESVGCVFYICGVRRRIIWIIFAAALDGWGKNIYNINVYAAGNKNHI